MGLALQSAAELVQCGDAISEEPVIGVIGEETLYRPCGTRVDLALPPTTDVVGYCLASLRDSGSSLLRECDGLPKVCRISLL